MGQSRETITLILQYGPKSQAVLNRQGIKAAQDYAESTFSAALRIREGGRWQIITTVLNSRRVNNSAQIQDLDMLDTEYALLVAEQEQSVVKLKNLIKILIKLLIKIAIVCIITYLFILSWPWRNIWSVYTT